MGQADIIVAWLAERGFEAHVKDAFAAATFQTPLIAAPRGIEVCVMDPGQAEGARDLLLDHFDKMNPRAEPDQAKQIVQATCDDCGETVEFPAMVAGTVQTCPRCGEYLDVPAHQWRTPKRRTCSASQTARQSHVQKAVSEATVLRSVANPLSDGHGSDHPHDSQNR
ncbi:MAG: hypothetical protein GY778_24235 [bacterium]|nr:hypothetical protein [bacterium]